MEQLPLDLPNDSPLAKHMAEMEKRIIAKFDEALENIYTCQPDRMWSLKEVAVYFDVSTMTARRILARPNAPKHYLIPTSKDSKLAPRWAGREVIAYSRSGKFANSKAVNY